MKRHKHLWPSFCTWNNFSMAANRMLKGKRMSREGARFSARWEDEIRRLLQELESGNYRPGPYHYFTIHEPKERIVAAAPMRDRFDLNVKLPIPFAGQGSMEVDFLHRKKKLVLELDGPHHFQDADAYRLDRMKDARLQERGYRVLRFLSNDLGANLNHVLDEIIRTLASVVQDRR